MLPEKFLERLKFIIPEDRLGAVVDTFAQEKAMTFRINRCHPDWEKYLDNFPEEIETLNVPWFGDAHILKNRDDMIKLEDAVQSGLIYRQSLSSMLAGVLLNVQPGDTVLDMCAAPGSKATQLASLMNNRGRIVALDHVRNRYYKLKSVINLMNATIVEPYCMDGRRYRPADIMFDRILVDAPCSSEGRFNVQHKKTYAYWSLRKIREMRKKQKGLLLNASRLLKPGGHMLYSTCTFAPEENEGVVEWFLRKVGDHIVPMEISLPPRILRYPVIIEWNEREFRKNVNKAVRILPTEFYDGFFIAVFKRKE